MIILMDIYSNTATNDDNTHTNTNHAVSFARYPSRQQPAVTLSTHTAILHTKIVRTKIPLIRPILRTPPGRLYPLKPSNKAGPFKKAS